MDYATRDDLPDLTASEMANAGVLILVPHPDPVTGYDAAADTSGVDFNTSFPSLFKFSGKEGATYDFTSMSFVDPDLLTIYDEFGNAIIANEEADDPAGIVRQDGTYMADVISNWQAPYTGDYYVQASWHQGSFLKIYSLDIFEDSDTAVPPGKIRVMTSDGFAGEVGGIGMIFGTNGFQHITLGSGELAFDPSFNRGGDIIELAGDASDYTIAQSGASAVLTGNSSAYTIPVGATGTFILFDDGPRRLWFDLEDDSMKIGNQSFDENTITIIADASDGPLPTGANPSAIGRIFMEEEAAATLGGNFQVFGSASEEHVVYSHGDLALDPSFNKGGDLLSMPDQAQAYSARTSGSSLVLSGADGDVTSPFGSAGMTIDFDGDERLLIFTGGQVMLGNQAIDANGTVLG